MGRQGVKMEYFNTLGLAVTLKTEPRSSQVDTSEILAMITIQYNLCYPDVLEQKGYFHISEISG